MVHFYVSLKQLQQLSTQINLVPLQEVDDIYFLKQMGCLSEVKRRSGRQIGWWSWGCADKRKADDTLHK